MTHAIQDQQGRLDEFEENDDLANPIPGYSQSPHEQEAMIIRNSFLSEMCDIPGFYDKEIIKK